MISLTINGQNLEVPDNTTVLQAASDAGIAIPTLCYHKDLSPFGGCRVCVVEVQGARLPMTSCILPVSPGLVVQTDTPAVIKYRKAVLRMLLKNYYDAAYKRYNGKTDLERDSELVRLAQIYAIDIRSEMSRKPLQPVDSDPNPFVWVDMNKCIQCTRCVRACAEVQGRFVWSQSFRGYRARMIAGADTTMLQARCELCGACVAYCPTGALDNKMSVTAGVADRRVQTTCTYCSVGCQLDLNVDDNAAGGRVIRVTSNIDKASINGLHLCVKGRYGYDFIHQPSRATRPRVREYLLDREINSEQKQNPRNHSRWVDVDWNTALQITAERLLTVRNELGGDHLAVLASGKLLNEENYLLSKFARQILGSDNIDLCSHIYHSGTVAGLDESLGISAATNPFEDMLNHSMSLLVLGANLTEQHPVLGAKIRQAVLRRHVKLVVANPDFTNMAEFSKLALYQHPNTEAALLNGLMHIIFDKGWHDRSIAEKYPQGFADFKANIDEYPASKVAAITGVPIEALYQSAEILAKNSPMAVLWSNGVADLDRGRRVIQSLVNLQMLLGNLDQPGGGIYPLRTQNNSQGACDMGACSGLLPGYQKLSDDYVRQRFEQAWGCRLPAKSGLRAAEILSAAAEGHIQALYILGEDILNTSSAGGSVRKSLEKCDLIILQVTQSSDVSRYADIILPAASFAEKTGTFTNAERRIQLVNQAIEPIGSSKPDWQIISELAHRFPTALEPNKGRSLYASWDYIDTEQIMQEIAALTPIYAGVSHARLRNGERLLWPVPSYDHPGTQHLAPRWTRWSLIEHESEIIQEPQGG